MLVFLPTQVRRSLLGLPNQFKLPSKFKPGVVHTGGGSSKKTGDFPDKTNNTRIVC